MAEKGNLPFAGKTSKKPLGNKRMSRSDVKKSAAGGFPFAPKKK